MNTRRRPVGHLFVGPVVGSRDSTGKKTGWYEFHLLGLPSGKVSQLAYPDKVVACKCRADICAVENAHRLQGLKVFQALVEAVSMCSTRKV